jgi:hypothetical protein
MTTTRSAFLLLFLGLSTAATAQTWGGLDCQILLDALHAHARKAVSLAGTWTR